MLWTYCDFIKACWIFGIFKFIQWVLYNFASPYVYMKISPCREQCWTDLNALVGLSKLKRSLVWFQTERSDQYPFSLFAPILWFPHFSVFICSCLPISVLPFGSLLTTVWIKMSTGRKIRTDKPINLVIHALCSLQLCQHVTAYFCLHCHLGHLQLESQSRVS